MTYNKLNVESSNEKLPVFAEEQPEKYQKFYLTTPAGEKSLREKLANDPEQVAACKKRLAELDGLLKIDDNRCHASRDQRNFLRRVLEPYNAS